MAIPTYDQFIAPLLRVLAEHSKGIRSRDAYEAVAVAVALSPEDRTVLLPSGQQAVYENRIGWAHDRLKRAGYSQSLQRGLWQLTEKGRTFAAAHPNGMDQATLDPIAFVPREKKAADAESSPPKSASQPPPPLVQQSPEERIDDALEELTESLSRDLLSLIAGAPPSFFERLVLAAAQRTAPTLIVA